MLVKELSEKILAAGGVITLKNIELRHEESKDIDIMSNGNLVLWIRAAEANPDTKVTDRNALKVSGDYLLKEIDGVIEFAQYIGLTVMDIKPVEVEKVVEKQVEVEKESPLHMEAMKTLIVLKEKLEGKVEAYENILMGRDITVGK